MFPAEGAVAQPLEQTETLFPFVRQKGTSFPKNPAGFFGRKRRKERIFAPQVKPAPQKLILAPYMPLLRINHGGAAAPPNHPGNC
jgi:hypothetical protein